MPWQRSDKNDQVYHGWSALLSLYRTYVCVYVKVIASKSSAVGSTLFATTVSLSLSSLSSPDDSQSPGSSSSSSCWLARSSRSLDWVLGSSLLPMRGPKISVFSGDFAFLVWLYVFFAEALALCLIVKEGGGLSSALRGLPETLFLGYCCYRSSWCSRS